MYENFIKNYLEEVSLIADVLDGSQIQKAIDIISQVKEIDGRLFILGVGGGSATASHAVNDFRKICKIESYTPVDNVAELTAITNDEGWEYSFIDWLVVSKLSDKDAIIVFSVGGGNAEKKISENLIHAIQYAKICNSKVIAIVGKDGGYVGAHADSKILIPVINTELITPHTEEFGGVILHLLVSHPTLKENITKWESIK